MTLTLVIFAVIALAALASSLILGSLDNQKEDLAIDEISLGTDIAISAFVVSAGGLAILALVNYIIEYS